MASSLTIRDATLDDLATIVDYNLRLAAESEGKRLDPATLQLGVRSLLSDPAHGRYFLACRDGNIVGQTMLTYEWSDWRNGQIWWIQSVYVEPASRRQGVFKALFQHIRHLAETLPGIAGLRLYVEEKNYTAHATYRALGLADAGYFVLERLRP